MRPSWRVFEDYQRADSFWLASPWADVPGEVYVLNDGGEVDLDLGCVSFLGSPCFAFEARADRGSLSVACSNYERYLDVTLSKNHNLTTGKVYQRVIEKEVRRRPALPFVNRASSLALSS